MFQTKIADGTKFTDAEVTNQLAEIARDYLVKYTGDFDYLKSLQASKKPLSIGMLRGILNCILAEMRRAAVVPVAAPTANYAAIAAFLKAATVKWPKLHLTTTDGTDIRLVLKSNAAKVPGVVDITAEAEVWNDYRGEYDRKWFGRITPDGTLTLAKCATQSIVNLVVALAADPVKVAAEYGHITSNCCFCHKALSTPESLAVGYGPICAAHYNLPWGETTKDEDGFPIGAKVTGEQRKAAREVAMAS